MVVVVVEVGIRVVDEVVFLSFLENPMKTEITYQLDLTGWLPLSVLT